MPYTSIPIIANRQNLVNSLCEILLFSKNLESFFEKKVRLNLWVKVKENWVARPEYLDMQGL